MSKIDYKMRFTPIIGDDFPKQTQHQHPCLENGEKVARMMRDTDTAGKWMVVHFIPRSHSELQLEQIEAMEGLINDTVAVVCWCPDSLNAISAWIGDRKFQQPIFHDVGNDVALDCGIIASEFSEPANAVYIIDPYDKIRWAQYSEFPITEAEIVNEALEKQFDHLRKSKNIEVDMQE